MILLVLGSLVLFGLIGAMVANNKGNSFLGGFVVGFLLGPIGIVYEAVHPVSSKLQVKSQVKQGRKMQPMRGAGAGRRGRVSILLE